MAESNAKSRESRILEGMAIWASFYRCNPHRFAKDYLNIDPLYTHDEILALYRYWDEIQLEILKMKIQEEYNNKVIDKLLNPQEFKVPKIGKKAVRKAYIKTLEEKNAQYRQEEENRKAAKEATSAEKEEAEKEWEYK